MSALRVKQIATILMQIFRSHLDLNDLGDKDKGKNDKILSRSLAAFAIYYLTGCDEKDAAFAVWDGGGDNGIDAAYVDASENRIILVQSKWINSGSGEPESKDISAFIDGVRDIIEQDSSSFAERLHGKFSEISKAIAVPGYTINVVVISTGEESLAEHATKKLDKILEEINGPSELEPVATYKIIGLPSIYKFLSTGKSPENISLDATFFDWSSVPVPYSAYFGIIDGLQLKNWWLAHGKRLVAKNIRHALGATDVNNQIRNTAINSPESFWYFNNGITLIADKVTKAPVSVASKASGNFHFEGASIVNGAQTVSTLGRIEDNEKVAQVRVPVRVIILSTAPEGFGGEVTRTNNLQNRVEARDFVAQDMQQTRLQMEMGIEGVEYQFLRSEDFIPSINSCELIEVTTALACASGDSSYAVQVKTGIGRFFLDLNKAPYKALFNPSLSGAKAFNATLVQREIDNWIDTKKKSLTKKSGAGWGVLIHGNRVIASCVFSLLNGNALLSPISEFRSSISSFFVNEKCESIYSHMVSIIEDQYPGKFLSVLFKNPSASKSIMEQAVKASKAKE